MIFLLYIPGYFADRCVCSWAAGWRDGGSGEVPRVVAGKKA